MRKKEVFYGIAGINAYGVYNDWDKVLESRKYIAEFQTKKWKGFDEAKAWAEETYEEKQYRTGGYYEIPEIKKVNWCYYRKKC